jgi:phosphoribosylglycinamide formyltransferase 1
VSAAPGRVYRATVLASGSGSNFEAVVEAARRGSVPLEVAALIVNRSGAGALERARRLAVPSEVVVWDRAAESRAAYDARLSAAVGATDPELVLLLGWMHILPAAFVERFPETLNLHPAYLPLEPEAEAVRFPDGSEGPAFRGASGAASASTLPDPASIAAPCWPGPPYASSRACRERPSTRKFTPSSAR